MRSINRWIRSLKIKYLSKQLKKTDFYQDEPITI